MSSQPDDPKANWINAQPASRRTVESGAVHPDEPQLPEDATQADEAARTERLPLAHPRSLPRFQPGDTPPPPGRRPEETRRRGGGCLSALLGIGGITLALVILALFLPPFSLWEDIDDAWDGDANAGSAQQAGEGDFVALTADTPRVDVSGLEIEAGDVSDSYSVRVLSLEPAAYLAADVPDEGWSCATDLPPRHALASRVYSLQQSGTPPARLTLTITPLDPAGPLALYTWNATSGVWEFLPAQPGETVVAETTFLPRCVAVFRAPESARAVGVSLRVDETLTPDLAAVNARVYPAGLRPVASGALQGVLPPGVEGVQGYAVLPLLQNFDDPAVIDAATVRQILENPTVRMDHARQIAAFALREDSGYAGVVIDYRDVPPDLRDPFSDLIRDVADLLHTSDLTLAVVLPAPAHDDAWDTGGYDWPALGRLADEITITLPLDPGAYAPGGLVEDLIAWASTQVSPDKLVTSLSALSVEEQESVMVPATLDTALGYLGVVTVSAETVAPGETVSAERLDLPGITEEIGYDEASHTAYIRYLDEAGEPVRTMWITDPGALRFRLDLAAQHRLQGVMVRDLFAPGTVSGLANAVLGFRLGQDTPAEPYDLALEWIISADGTVIEQMPGTLDEPLTVQAQEGQTELTVEAQVNGVSLGSQAVAVAAAPVVEEAPAEETPPEGEPSAEVEAPADGGEESSGGDGAVASAAIPDFQLPPPVVPAGASGSFEGGGSLRAMAGPPVLAAGRSGLKWLRFEIEYTLGASPEAYESRIGEVQANGLKILLSVNGSADELATTDRAEYINQYADFVGGLAALGADGIEIWRNMNHSRSWPTTDVNPAEYVQLLALSYNAIKGANPNTLVITGGITPTDVAGEAGRTASDWNDDVYWAGLAEAGAAQYADCIGIIYLRGAVAPDATTGDPRGDSPTLYLPTVIERARTAFNKTLPVCFTRFGYLSAEGYGPLPDNYSWAQGITTAQQAEWLAAAITSARGGDAVRLLVIWSLDTPVEDTTNPGAGYGILRPDGSCPACEAIQAVLVEQ
jgi:hypothetical protein